ncbi:hypothetical protein DFH06DRAFT_591910 [Mycena polygramma]|nr:hypothetical protein DFH06DRAFT_591910 [Mycena polygramma]
MDSDTPRTSCSSFFFHPPKVSSPIEIPGRQHDEYALPPAERTTSPELIFEMELSPIERLSTHYSFGLSTSPRTKEKDADPEPLLYPFPVAHHIDTHTHPRTRPPQNTASFSLPPITHQPPKSHRRSKSTLQLGSPPPEPDPAHAIRAVPLHKITGFTPDDGAAPLPLPEAARPAIENAHANAKAPREKQKQPLTPLTPPPRLASSPWVREASASDDELSLRALDVDPGAGADFTQYLLRRIDSQKPLQFQTFRVMSVSVR